MTPPDYYDPSTPISQSSFMKEPRVLATKLNGEKIVIDMHGLAVDVQRKVLLNILRRDDITQESRDKIELALNQE